MIRERYQHQANRDRRARVLADLGYQVTRRSVRSQELSPDYVKDYLGEGSPNGYGGAATEFFPVLYIVEAR